MFVLFLNSHINVLLQQCTRITVSCLPQVPPSGNFFYTVTYKTVCYLQRIFNRYMKLKQQANELNALKLKLDVR